MMAGDDELRLRVERSDAGAYVVSADGGPTEPLDLLLDPLDPSLAEAVARIEAGQSSDGELRRFGGRLFTGLVSGRIEQAYRAVEARGGGMRVVVDLGRDAALHRVPWTYLFDDRRQQFVATEIGIRGRPLSLVAPVDPAVVEPVVGALRVLIVSADPHGVRSPIDVEREVRAIQDALANAGQPPAEHVVNTTIAKLSDAADRAAADPGHRPHVVHFIAHGEEHPTHSQLLLENDARFVMAVRAATLNAALKILVPGLRLVVFNVCGSYEIAREVAQLGVATIGCRARIGQEPALTLASTFYQALLRGEAVDAALNGARNKVVARHPDYPRDWGLAVLFLPRGDARTCRFLPSPSRPAEPDGPGGRRPVVDADRVPVERPAEPQPGRVPRPVFRPRERRAGTSELRQLVRFVTTGAVGVVALAAVGWLVVSRWGGDGTVAIAGGSFARGAPRTPLSDLITSHLSYSNIDRTLVGPVPATVTLAAPFVIDRFEVRRGDYLRFLKGIGSAHERCHPDEPPAKSHRQTDSEKTGADPDLPIVGIDWWDAFAYCAWAGKRLPTGDEWERAARGTDGRWYTWGSEFRPGAANTAEAPTETPTRAGAFPDDRSAEGVVDLVGNVAEWIGDPFPDNAAARGVRGGGFTGAGAFYGLLFNRQFLLANTRATDIGLRCARAAEGAVAETEALVPAGPWIRGSEDSPFLNLLRRDRVTGDAFRAQFVVRPSPGRVGAFRIDRDEVTNRKYRAFLEARTHATCHPREPAGKDHTPKFWSESGYNADDQPVVGVDWYDAYAYAQWAGARLPTEDEWERAARGVEGRRYPWGDVAPTGACVGNDTPRTAARPVVDPTDDETPDGVRHLGGNVSEWTDTEQRFEDDVYRVVRGGSWAVSCDLNGLGWFRNVATPDYRGPQVGFRCVR
jgi:formylglycine-generating enzyme required for sulfatase activity